MLFRASTAPEIFNMFFWNIIIVSAYHFIIFAICVKLPQSSFDENKSRYQMKKFERNGKFYKQTLKNKCMERACTAIYRKRRFFQRAHVKQCFS